MLRDFHYLCRVMNDAIKMSGRMLLPVLAALVLLAVIVAVGRSCGTGQANPPVQEAQPLTAEETALALESDSLMYVTSIERDSSILRTPSTDVPGSATEALKTLMAKMLYTVKDPSQDGVGIAAPQVGINRRVIWVQRFDKPGEPFECYLNVKIDSLGAEMVSGGEGCLSVPPKRGIVKRASKIKVSYIDPGTGESRSETVEGYTARIFQHECDHLDGILYTDRADTVYIDEEWATQLARR